MVTVAVTGLYIIYICDGDSCCYWFSVLLHLGIGVISSLLSALILIMFIVWSSKGK